jgi:hypothetical protein
MTAVDAPLRHKSRTAKRRSCNTDSLTALHVLLRLIRDKMDSINRASEFQIKRGRAESDGGLHADHRRWILGILGSGEELMDV